MPKLSYSIHILSQFRQAPRGAHIEAARRVLRYLKGNLRRGTLLQNNSNLKQVAFCYSNWGVCPTTHKSLTGYLVTLGRSPVSWRTKKQTNVSHSPAEIEYRVMATITSDLI